jgi:hypothetical protein
VGEIADDVIVTKAMIGLTGMQVCAFGRVPPEIVEDRVNALNPTGISSRWRILWERENCKPVQCADDPARLD